MSKENTPHLFLIFPFSHQMWKEIGKSLGLLDLWKRDYILSFFQEWDLKGFRCTPLLALWGIKLAQNFTLFQDNFVPPFQVVA